MKLQFNSLIKCAAALFCGASLFACTELSELEERVDSLDSRITALETQIPALQGNIDAVQAMFNEQIFITSITTNDAGDEYTLKMSDGKNYTIKQGKIGNTPQIAVDENNYWIVSYDNGATFSRIKGTDGEELTVKAAPQFRVDSDGNWEISADGTNWTDAADPDGNPVKAVGEGGDFFQDIAYDDESGKLTLTLGDGKEYTFTVTTDFVCQIINDLNPVEFSPGQTKEFDVKLRGVQSIYITRPEGWTVKLDGDEAADPATEIVATLTVTAPAAAGIQTKVSADTDRDIVLHATAASSERSIFAKMSVAVKVDTAPDAEIEISNSTEKSIVFNVTPNELVGTWKYMLLPKTEAEPNADSEGWTDGTNNSLNLTVDAKNNNITAGTTYILYVLVTSKESVTSIIVKSDEVTPAYATLYDNYINGVDIKINGLVINKDKYGTAVLIDGTEKTAIDNITTGEKEGIGVYFLNTDAAITFTTNGKEHSKNIGTLILIGNDPEKKAKVTLSKQIHINRNTTYSNDQSFICHNIIFDASNLSAYPIIPNTTNKYDNLIFNECDIKIPVGANLMYCGADGKDFGKIALTSCTLNITGRNNKEIIATGGFKISIDEFNFSNNVIYATGNSVNDARIITMTGATLNKMYIANNSFVNAFPAVSKGNQSLFAFGTCKEIECTKNLVLIGYQSTDAGSASFMRYSTSVTGDCKDNIVYKTNASDPFATVRYNSAIPETLPFNEGSSNFTIIESNPYDGGTFDVENVKFIPNSTYSSYGSTIGR